MQPLPASRCVTKHVLLGCGLYYGVLLFNLTMTLWIGEALLGLVGVMIYLPVTILFILRLLNRIPGAVLSLPPASPQRLARER
jgi:putative membrane protein